MIKNEIAKSLTQSILRAQEKGLLPHIPLPDILIEHPQNPDHGDYAATVAMKLARAAKMNPFAIAEIIARMMPSIDGVDRVSVVHPGFINFALSRGWLTRQVDEILRQAEKYGDSDLGRGARLQLEFVSVNPTGPLHVGHGRGAVLGSTLANILSRCGYAVQKEYYINDAGNQIENFCASLYARFCQFVLDRPVEIPPDGYHGTYMIDLARELQGEKPRLESLPDEEAQRHLGRVGLERMLEQIRADLALLGVEFDVWFSEQRELHDTGRVAKIIERLRQEGYTEEREGALWFVSTGLGEDRDNVLIRSNGTPTYFAADIAYHYNKFMERKFDRVVDVWGADHQGHISRVKAAMAALGIPPEKLEIIIAQMVSLRRGDEVVKVSKRTGELITLREVIEEVGPDVCRFFFLSRSATSQMDFDLELAKKQSLDNPVYYVQYGHARIAGVMRLAREKGIDFSQGDPSLLTNEAEVPLIKQLVLFPEIIELAARNLEPHHLPHYAMELSTAFHNFYEKCRIVTDDRSVTAARLKLVEAARIVLAKTLRLMGMGTPERM